MKKGFTLVELMLVMGITLLIASIGAVNFFSTSNQTNVGSSKDVLVADLRSAQAKAMLGTAVSGTAPVSWGVKFLAGSYVVFSGNTYIAGASNNYVVTLPTGITLTTTFPSGQVLFSHNSGEVTAYNQATDTITLTAGSSSKTIELNQLGVSTGD